MKNSVSSPTATVRDALGPLPVEDRRAALAAWLSDANAVPDSPGLRRIDGGAVVPVDELLAALQSLDEPPAEARAPASPASLASPARWRAAFGRRRPRAQGGGLKVLIRRRRDDDDDPPPCPAVAGLPVAPAGFGAAV